MSKEQSLFPPGVYDEPMEILRRVMAMLGGDVAQWTAFAQQIREMRHAQATASYGVPHSKKKAQKLERAVDSVLKEIADQLCPSDIDFTRTPKGGAK